MNYDNLYRTIVQFENWYASNAEWVKDILDVTKVFSAVGIVFSISIPNSIIEVNNQLDMWIKIFQLLAGIAGFIYVLYKITEIHNRLKSGKKRTKKEGL